MSDSDYEVRLKTTGRNDDCPCGSGKKYKKCHLAEDEATQTATLQALEEESVARAKASQETEGEVDASRAKESTRSKQRQMQKPGSKGRRSDGAPGDIPRRGAM